MNKQEIEKAIELLKRSTLLDVTYTTEEHDKALQMAISALQQQLTNGWIPVTERLPDKYEYFKVHVTIIHKETGHSFPDRMQWEFGKFSWYNGKELSSELEIVAWKIDYLPEPYKEDK